MNIFPIIQFIGESTLSFYPILIKLTKLDVPFNTFIRLATYFILASLFSNYDIISNISIYKILFLSVVNIIHILASYHGNRNLNTTIGVPLFYVYPFINIILGILFLNETISSTKFLFIGPILYSIYKLYLNNKDDNQHKQNLKVGIPLILLAAFTESLIYITIKTTELGFNPWNSIFITYFFAAIIYTIHYFNSNKISEIKKLYYDNKPDVHKLIFANMFIGLFGYAFRFMSIKRVPTLLYTVISYTGISSAILFGAYFNLDTINGNKIFWIICLILSLIGLKIY